MTLSFDQWQVLSELTRYPLGRPFKGENQKEAILELCKDKLVCDPHTMGSSMFTRITEKGAEALKNYREHQ